MRQTPRCVYRPKFDGRETDVRRTCFITSWFRLSFRLELAIGFEIFFALPSSLWPGATPGVFEIQPKVGICEKKNCGKSCIILQNSETWSWLS